MSNFETLRYIFGELEVTCHVAKVQWQWCGFLLSSSLHSKECLRRQCAYLDFLYNPAPESNWPHSLTTYVPLTLSSATFVEAALGSILRRRIYDVFEIYLASNYTR